MSGRINFKVYNRYTIVEGSIPSIVYKICSFKTKVYTRIKGSKKTKFEWKTVSLFLHSRRCFPTGLAGTIMRELSKNNIEYTYEDMRNKPLVSPVSIDIFPPRFYQKEALDEALRCSRGVIQMPCAAGKTAVAAYIISKLGLSTLYIVPSTRLLHQTADFMRRCFGKDKIGIIGDNEFNISLINIATAQTLWSRIKRGTITYILDNTNVLIIDEAHIINKSIRNRYSLTNTWYRIAMDIDAYYRFGFTATPGKDDSIARKLLEATTGRIIYSISYDTLVEHGYLVKPEVDIYTINNGTLDYTDGTVETWSEERESLILLNDERNNKIVNIAREYASEGKSVLITVDLIEKHGNILKEMMPEATFMVSKTDKKEKERIIEDFKNKDIKILISTIMGLGVDIPTMDVVILANGGKGGESNRSIIQRAGRVLRISEGKVVGKIVDFYDKCTVLRISETSGNFYKKPAMVERHSIERVKAYKERGFEINYKF